MRKAVRCDAPTAILRAMYGMVWSRGMVEVWYGMVDVCEAALVCQGRRCPNRIGAVSVTTQAPQAGTASGKPYLCIGPSAHAIRQCTLNVCMYGNVH